VILHITTEAAWANAKANAAYAADSLATEGFIHCSTPSQVVWVANNRFRGRTDLVLLHIDPSKIDAEIRYENLESGRELFPHVYGPIPVAAIVEVTPFRPSVDGSFSQRQS
jgi:uncharacterized protein (DUF952 family)